MERRMSSIDHRKRRRRRRADRPPVSGWIQPSEELKGNVGVISYDLYTDLFRTSFPGSREVVENERPRYIAITPWSPLVPDLVTDATWTLIPVRAQTAKEEEIRKLSTSSVQFSASSLALQTFAAALQDGLGGKGNVKGKAGIEVRILEVEPLNLETIYVTVDGDALDKHDEVQKKFGGGFPGGRANGYAGKGRGKGKAGSHEELNGFAKKTPINMQDDQLTAAIREALAASKIVRQNDFLSLPLPAHPITHVPLPPAKITSCEPVNQGLIHHATRIVVNRVHHADPADRGLPSLASRKPLRGMVVESGDDASNERFYSAAEDNVKGSLANSNVAVESNSDTENSGKGSGSSSDDSLENVISMSVPSIARQSSGMRSSRTAATPRAMGPRTNGLSTPGSVFSNYTATTARQGTFGKSKTFKARCLSGKIPEELLYPNPGPEEDDEARIFVDVKSLLKLGCFSGDWVKVETVSKPEETRSPLWGIDAFGNNESQDEFRPMKIYGLSGLQSNSAPRYAKQNAKERRSSVISAPFSDAMALVAWLSPIVLANLGQAEAVRLSPLLSPSQENVSARGPNKITKISSASSPPIAKELTLLRISTPLSTERTLQTGLFTVLKQHFEKKCRILCQGDLIALPFDVSFSRLLAQPPSAADLDQETEELLNLRSHDQYPVNTSIDVTWFRVGQINASGPDGEQLVDSEMWGNAASIDPMSTRMRQAGSEQSRIPSPLDNSWEYYLGARTLTRGTASQNVVTRSTTSLFKPYLTPLRRRLRELIAAAASPRAVHLGMGPMIILLHSTQRNIGKSTVASRAASDLGIHVFGIDAYDILAEGAGGGDVKTEAFLKARVDRALSCGASCTAVLLRHVEALTADRMVSALKEVVADVRVLIATTTEIDKIPDGVRSIFTHELELVAPDEGEREGTLRAILEERSIRLANDVDLGSIAVKTAALVAGNLVDIVDRAVAARQERLEGLISKITSTGEGSTQILVRDLIISGGDYSRCVLKADFDVAVEAARKNFADAIGAPKIPNVSWKDVGGLENVKDAVMETIQLPLERPELFAKGMKKRSGILLYGPPGTGKTLLAKAIATEFSLNFFSVKGPELLNMYIGESEANVRRVFQRARDARPCVVFFDELDSVAPKRGNQGDSGGVMDRIVSQLLAELDGMSDGDEGGGGVFVIGATNRPDLLDQALLRPGRFDKMLYLGVSDTHEKQLTIMEALTRKFTMHPQTSLLRVAESLPFTYTGADLYALCSDAMLKAITRQASAVDAKIRELPGGPVTTAYFFDHLATGEDVAVMVTEEDFFAAQMELVGSVS